MELAEIAALQGLTVWELMGRLSKNCIQANSQALQIRGRCEM